MSGVKALSMFSGGLDSILATKLLLAQELEVEAISFTKIIHESTILLIFQGFSVHVSREGGQLRTLLKSWVYLLKPYVLEMSICGWLGIRSMAMGGI